MGAFLWFRDGRVPDEGHSLGLELPYGTELPRPSPDQVIIPWGRGEPLSSSYRGLNTDEAARHSADGALRLLRASGLRTVEGRGRSRPLLCREVFAIPVFHLEALSARERTPAAAWGDFAAPRPQRIGKMMELAARAVYALGLDYAVVDVTTADGGRMAIAHVDPYPALDGPYGADFVRAINAFGRRLEEEVRRCRERRPAMLGADLELLLVGGDSRVVSADRYFSRGGPLGCDAVVGAGGNVEFPLAEIRPAPSHDPRSLVGRIRAILRRAEEKTRRDGLRLLAGAMPAGRLPLGGHIHFSGMWANVFFIRALDAYLSVPLAAVEDPAGAGRRPKYGFPGDIRRQRHGGFEYRTLPSWIVSPRIALATLCLAKLIADNYWALPGFPRAGDRLPPFALYAGGRERLLARARRLWRALEALPDYGSWEAELSAVKTMLEAGRSWNEQRDLRLAWRLGPPAAEKREARP